jgi:hypothetical protein
MASLVHRANGEPPILNPGYQPGGAKHENEKKACSQIPNPGDAGAGKVRAFWEQAFLLP